MDCALPEPPLDWHLTIELVVHDVVAQTVLLSPSSAVGVALIEAKLMPAIVTVAPRLVAPLGENTAPGSLVTTGASYENALFLVPTMAPTVMMLLILTP
jgi:hypothetical protein